MACGSGSGSGSGTEVGNIVAQLDDRDVAQVLGQIECDGHAVSDDALLAWLENGSGALTLRIDGRLIAIEPIKSGDVARHFNFTRMPAPGPIAQ